MFIGCYYFLLNGLSDQANLFVIVRRNWFGDFEIFASWGLADVGQNMTKLHIDHQYLIESHSGELPE